MANNNLIYNAALAGATGGATDERWITSSVSDDYVVQRNAAVAFAEAVDAAVANDPDMNEGKARLMTSICTAVLNKKAFQSADVTSAIAVAIAALYNEVSPVLEAEAGGGAPLSLTLWVDEGAAEGGNGSIANPYNDLQDAIDALDPLVTTAGHSGAIICAAGTYDTANWTATEGVTIVGLGTEATIIGQVIVGEGTNVQLLNLTADGANVLVNATLRASNCDITAAITPDATGRVEIDNSSIVSVDGNGVVVFDNVTVSETINVGASGEVNIANSQSNGAEPSEILCGSIRMRGCSWGGSITADAEVNIDSMSYNELREGGHSITSPVITLTPTTIQCNTIQAFGNGGMTVQGPGGLQVSSNGQQLDMLDNSCQLATNAPGLLELLVDTSPVFSADATGIAFNGNAPIAKPSITGATTQLQVDSLVSALVALGLVTDNR